jgi:hypothetical protein
VILFEGAQPAAQPLKHLPTANLSPLRIFPSKLQRLQENAFLTNTRYFENAFLYQEENC